MNHIVHTSSGIALAFGPFRLLPLQRLVLRDDTPLRLGSRAREILLALVERAGHIVKKSELIARVWPDTIVEEATLRVHIAALRKALGDGQSGMRYVENITGHGYRFVAPVTQVEDARPTHVAPSSVPEHAHNLPAPLTRIVGREEVVATLASRLPSRRFVTLVGAGGIGKTTVAVAAADQLSEAYPHGIRFVDLAAITDATLIAGTVASALGLATVLQDPMPNIIEFLKRKRILIVLDNCEHIVEAAALLAERLLAGAPDVHILATSREPLRATNEWVLRLAPLEMPPPSAILSAKKALDFSAIQLFAERATGNLDTFELHDTDVPVVADICRRLDGLPLAIELAAARVCLFGIRGLAANLDDRLGLLTRGRRTALPRHQTLRATLDWSYEILAPLEQIALRRLAVFSGSFDAPSASAVVVDSQVDAASVLDVLTNLAAKSLIAVHVAGDQVLYRLLKTFRAYALEKLEFSNESAGIKRRHAELACAWGEADLDWEPRCSEEWLAANGQRIDDVRAALDWCFSEEGDALVGVKLTATSAPLWFQRSFLDEYRGRLERALEILAAMPNPDLSLELQLNAALGEAILFTTGAGAGVTAALKKTREIAEQLGTTAHHQRALWGLWVERVTAADYQAAIEFAETFCAAYDRSGDPAAILTGDRMMMVANHCVGNHSIARHHAERVLRQRGRTITALSDRALQFDHRVAAHALLTRVLWIQGYPEQAIRAGHDGLICAVSIGHSLSVCYALCYASIVSMWCGDVAEARRLIGMLRDHAGRHTLLYWLHNAQCLEAALDQLGSTKPAAHPILWNPMCNTVHKECLLTLSEALATDETILRAEQGLSGWNAPEALRVKGERLLWNDYAHADRAETVFQESLDLARHQGAVSWELRTAMSLARLWHDQGRSRDARDLLASVYTRFTEGFGTADLRKARSLLDEVSVPRLAARRA